MTSPAKDDTPFKRVAVLGTRGLPAKHGGFETFVEFLAPFLAQHGWHVSVYCQILGSGGLTKSKYRGVELIHVPIKSDTPVGTIRFDWKSTRHACKHHPLLLTLGYNTGFLSVYTRVMRRRNVINMDGLEWKRSKWSWPVKVWFFLNEIIACWMGNALVADHPQIKRHLESRVSAKKIIMIPYGSDCIEDAQRNILDEYGLKANRYSIVVARPEPENMILEVVQAYSRTKTDCPLVVLGNYTPDQNVYHQKVLDAAGPHVKFVGAIYDRRKVQALRFFSKLYIHGHTVGGTNPSLVEALGAGCPVLAHDNCFNRWVTRNEMQYFVDVDDCSAKLREILSDDLILAEMKAIARKIHRSSYQWENILKQYLTLLEEQFSIVAKV